MSVLHFQLMSVLAELLHRPRPIPLLRVDVTENEQVLHLLHLREAELVRVANGPREVDAGPQVGVPAIDEPPPQLRGGRVELEHDVDSAGPLECRIDEAKLAVGGEDVDDSLVYL